MNFLNHIIKWLNFATTKTNEYFMEQTFFSFINDSNSLVYSKNRFVHVKKDTHNDNIVVWEFDWKKIHIFLFSFTNMFVFSCICVCVFCFDPCFIICFSFWNEKKLPIYNVNYFMYDNSFFITSSSSFVINKALKKNVFIWMIFVSIIHFWIRAIASITTFRHTIVR